MLGVIDETLNSCIEARGDTEITFTLILLGFVTIF